VENAVIQGGAGDALVEDGNFDLVVLLIERLEVEVGGECAGGAEHVEEGVEDGVGAADDGAEGAHRGVDHEHTARADPEGGEVGDERTARGGQLSA
jgi:hypothetical protein